MIGLIGEKKTLEADTIQMELLVVDDNDVSSKPQPHPLSHSRLFGSL